MLHQPIAAALRIYNAAFQDIRHVERKHLDKLLAVKEEGLQMRNLNRSNQTLSQKRASRCLCVA
jgi:hypothetical protein